MKTPVSIPQLLDASTDVSLSALLRRAHDLQRLERVIQTILEPPLRQHCRVANLRDGNLILITDSPVWATRLRYVLPGLLASLPQTATWARIHRIDIKVRLASERHEEPPRPRPVLSVQAVALLRDVAGKCEDESLTAAFLRIAGRG